MYPIQIFSTNPYQDDYYQNLYFQEQSFLKSQIPLHGFHDYNKFVVTPEAVLEFHHGNADQIY